MLRMSRLLVCAAALLGASAAGHARAEGSWSAVAPPLVTTKLENGLTAVFLQNPRSTRVTVAVVHPIGSADEPRRGTWSLLHDLGWNYFGTKRMPTAEVRRWQDDGVRITWDWRQD